MYGRSRAHSVAASLYGGVPESSKSFSQPEEKSRLKSWEITRLFLSITMVQETNVCNARTVESHYLDDLVYLAFSSMMIIVSTVITGSTTAVISTVKTSLLFI